MNKTTLALLSVMAPKEPEKWAIDEWDAKFELDYPKPWEPVDCDEYLIASVEATLASFGAIEFSPEWYSSELHRSEAERHARFSNGIRWIKNQPLVDWRIWRDEFLEEWARNEWPLIWAKKRLEATNAQD